MYLLFFFMVAMSQDFLETFGPIRRLPPPLIITRHQPEKVPIVPETCNGKKQKATKPIVASMRDRPPVVTDTRTNKIYISANDLLDVDYAG